MFKCSSTYLCIRPNNCSYTNWLHWYRRHHSDTGSAHTDQPPADRICPWIQPHRYTWNQKHSGRVHKFHRSCMSLVSMDRAFAGSWCPCSLWHMSIGSGPGDWRRWLHSGKVYRHSSQCVWSRGVPCSLACMCTRPGPGWRCMYRSCMVSWRRRRCRSGTGCLWIGQHKRIAIIGMKQLHRYKLYL